MKTMSCNQLGGACNKNFKAKTFKEMALLSKQHGKEMFEKSDKAHLEAMDKMEAIMNNPKAMENWMKKKKKEFEQSPEKN